MILYIENPKDSTHTQKKNLLEIKNTVKLQYAKSIYKTLLYFYMLAMS